MSSVIASEAQAVEVGKRITGGEKGRDFTVFQYTQPRSNLTLFGVETRDRRTIFYA